MIAVKFYCVCRLCQERAETETKITESIANPYPPLPDGWAMQRNGPWCGKCKDVPIQEGGADA